MKQKTMTKSWITSSGMAQMSHWQMRMMKSRQIHYDDAAIDRLLDREKVGYEEATLDDDYKVDMVVQIQ